MRRSSAPLRRALIGSSGAAQALSTLQQVLINDMTLPHEGPLDGVPSYYDWAAGPRMGYGNSRGPADAWTAATAWGQVYSSNNPSTNTLVEVRNLSLYLLSGGTWTVLQETKIAGATGIDAGFFVSNYDGNEVAPNTPITTAEGTRAGRPNPLYNMHFFPQGRATVGAGIQAIAVSFDARLIVANPSGNDDRASARFLAGAGADYWQNTTVGWVEGFQTNGDAAIARMRWVTSDWQTFTMTTATVGQIQTNPPPITLAGTAGSTPGGSIGGGGGASPSDGWIRPTGTIRIMPLGDSITAFQGTDPTGWVTMPARFSAAGYSIVTVGNESGWNGIKHEGHGAWCADDVAGRCTHPNGYHAGGLIQSVTPWLAAHTPDVVVLNIGTNDRYVVNGWSDTQIRDAISTLLDIITSARPTAMVLLTKLRYSDELSGSWTTNNNLNGLLAQLVTEKRAAGKLVRIFDAYATVNSAADFRDYLHPSAQGVGKMMDATYAELLNLFSGSGPVNKPDLEGPGGDPENPPFASLVHDFPGSTLDPAVWTTETGPGGPVVVAANNAIIPRGSSISSASLFSMVNSSVQLRLNTATQGPNGAWSLSLASNGVWDLGYIGVFADKASNFWTAEINGIETPYQYIGDGSWSPEIHLYWRFRHDGTLMHIERSATGVSGSWFTVASFTVPAEFNLAACTLVVGTGFGLSEDLSSLSVSKINVISSPMLFSSFTHNFPGAALDTGVWDSYGGTLVVTGNTVRVPVTTYSGINTKGLFDLTNNSVYFRADISGLSGSNSSWYAQVRCDGADVRVVTLSGYQSPSSLNVRLEGSGVTPSTVWTGSYYPPVDQWFRFRHNSGTGRIYVEKAVNGPNNGWTVLCDFAVPAGYTVGNMDLQLATRDTGSGYVSYSKVNLPS